MPLGDIVGHLPFDNWQHALAAVTRLGVAYSVEVATYDTSLASLAAVNVLTLHVCIGEQGGGGHPLGCLLC